MKWTFPVVTLHAYKRVRCAKCRKWVRRERTFYQTINPLNVDADGVPKTRHAIVAELKAEGAAWDRERELCTRCAGAT